MTEEIYKPPGAVSLDSQDVNFQIRTGLQGYPGTGKTWAATTFKNPIFLSYDRGLVSHIGRKDILEVPFYDGNFVDKVVKREGLKLPPNRKDALITWLSGEGLKLTREQTLILDASTGIEFAYHRWWEINKEGFSTKSGEIDARKEWRLKLDYFGEIATIIKEVHCNVVYICHEAQDRNDKGDLTGGVRPLLTGAFQDSLIGNFTDWYRCHSFAKPTDVDKFKEYFLKTWAYIVKESEIKEWVSSTPAEHSAFYLWQTTSDNICKCKTSLVGAPKFILAHSKSFEKYKRQQPKEQ